MSLARIAAKQSPPYSRIRSGKRGVKGGNLRSGRSSSTSASRSPTPRKRAALGDEARRRRRARRAAPRRARRACPLSSSQPDHPAAAAPLDRVGEVADEILGLFLDLDIAVAQHAERAVADARRSRGTAARRSAGPASRPRCSAPSRPAGGRSAASSPGSSPARGSARRPTCGTRSNISAEALVGDERERMRRIERLRGQDREDLLAEMRLQPRRSPRPSSARRSCASDTAMPVSASSRRRSRQTSCWLAISASALGDDRGELLRRRQPVGRAAARRPAAAGPCRPATRTMKNSSRLLPEIDRKRSRSSSGCAGLHASSSTRRLKASQRQLAVEIAIAGRRRLRPGADSGSSIVVVDGGARCGSGLRHRCCHSFRE